MENYILYRMVVFSRGIIKQKIGFSPPNEDEGVRLGDVGAQGAGLGWGSSDPLTLVWVRKLFLPDDPA
jgi:hypothetical protein